MNLQVPRSGDGAYELGGLPSTSAPSATTNEAAQSPLSSPPAPALPTTAAPEAEATSAPTAQQAEAQAQNPEPAPEAQATAPPKPKRKRRKGRRWDVPSWGVSLMVHLAVLISMAMAVTNVAPELIASLDAAMIDTELSEKQANELLHIDADPTDAERSEAIDTSSLMAFNTSPTPNINSRPVEQTEDRSLRSIVPVSIPTSTTATLPTDTASLEDFSGSGRFSGDVTRTTGDIGEALDQLAREILAQLQKSKVTVVWLFDESGSMKDDQRAIRDKFDRVMSQLNIHAEADAKSASALQHAIVSYGENIHFDYARPTNDLNFIHQAIDRIPIDESGIEHTMAAIINTVNYFDRRIEKDRRILLVIATDESGDEGDLVESAQQVVTHRQVPVYILGRQAMFGYPTLRLQWKDPVTGDTYWPRIDRGPEAPGLENIQYDGLYRDRREEQPSGFAPYELARIVKASGGIYFILPTSENDRVRQRERAYSMDTLQEYIPDGRSRKEYSAIVASSALRRTIVEVADLTQKNFGFQENYPIEPAALAEAIRQEVPKVDVQLQDLLEIEKRLRALEGARDRDPSQRWKAHYDLMLAQVVTYQVKAYEYRACLQEMVTLARQGKLVPKTKPGPTKLVEWALRHSKEKKAPESETAKKYEEAERLLKQVIERHPKTPWADFAQTELDRGFGCDRSEWVVHPDYRKRAENVPKF
ncbi:VWA domain-containing protein [soil metagenome]